MLPGTCSPSEPVLYLAHLNSDLPFYILPVMLKLELCKFPFPDSFVTWPPCHVLPKEGSEADWKMEGGKKILLVFFLGGGFLISMTPATAVGFSFHLLFMQPEQAPPFQRYQQQTGGTPYSGSENQSHRTCPALLDSGNPQIPFICLVLQVAMASCVSISVTQ